MDSKQVILSLSIGERVALMFLLNNFEGDRTSSMMRKTKRIKHAIDYLHLPENQAVLLLVQATEMTGAALDLETVGWLWDLFTKFSHWPTQLDEWIPDLEDKLRAAVAEGKGA